MRDYRRLQAFQRAHALVVRVMRAAERYPRSQRFGLVEQTQKSAISIPSNISEGAGRGSDTDYARFIRYAVGSANELEYQLLLARDLGFLGPVDHDSMTSELREIRAMLVALSRTLRRRGESASH